MDSIEDAVTKSLAKHDDLILELGCGDRKRHKSSIGIDQIKNDDVDIVGDIYKVLEYFPDKCVSAVYSYHCFEHLHDIPKVMDLLSRIMKNGSKLIVVCAPLVVVAQMQ